MSGQPLRPYVDAAMKRICPSQEELIAFREASLPAALHSEIDAHAKSCAGCREQLADLADFLDPPRPGEPERPATMADFQRVWRRVAPQRQSRWKLWWQPSFRPVTAFAVVAVVGLAFSVSQSVFTTRAMRSEQAAIERENATLREKLSAHQAWTPPRRGAAVVDLFPLGSTLRSAGVESVAIVRVPRGSPVTLVLTAKPAPGARYLLEIVQLPDKPIWRGEGAEQTDGGFIATLPNGFPTPGDYELRILTGTSQEARVFAAYRVRFELATETGDAK